MPSLRRSLRRRTLFGLGAGTVAAGLSGCSGGGQDHPTATGSEPRPSGGSPSAPSASASPSLATLPAEVVNGPRDRPQVALTFHGQGDPAIANRLLAAGAEAGAKFTVLAVGTWLAEQGQLARKILDGGHELGNHTQRHLAIADMPAEQAYAEIEACAAQLRTLTGSIGTWFRPSQTQHATQQIEAQAARVGYRTCLSYDVDSLDYTDPGAKAIVRTTLGAVRNGSIVSLHFGHAGTVTALPEILDGLRQRGLRAVTMTELMA